MIILKKKAIRLSFFLQIIMSGREINAKGFVWILKEILILNVKKNLDDILPSYIDKNSVDYLIG